MATQQVPRERWKELFDEFSKTHLGKLTTVQVHGRGAVRDEEAHAIPFLGATLEQKGSEADSVRVMLGDGTNSHLTHEIPSPEAVWVRTPELVAGEMLEIHGSDDQTIILTFQEESGGSSSRES